MDRIGAKKNLTGRVVRIKTIESQKGKTFQIETFIGVDVEPFPSVETLTLPSEIDDSSLYHPRGGVDALLGMGRPNHFVNAMADFIFKGSTPHPLDSVTAKRTTFFPAIAEFEPKKVNGVVVSIKSSGIPDSEDHKIKYEDKFPSDGTRPATINYCLVGCAHVMTVRVELDPADPSSHASAIDRCRGTAEQIVSFFEQRRGRIELVESLYKEEFEMQTASLLMLIRPVIGPLLEREEVDFRRAASKPFHPQE